MHRALAKAGNALAGMAVVALIVAVIGGVVYLDWSAYHHRFPNAPFWTFLFSR